MSEGTKGTALDDLDRIKKVIDAIGIGTPAKHACEAEGILYGTFKNWITKGKKEEKAWVKAGASGEMTKCHDLYDQITRARARGIRSLQTTARKHAKSDPRTVKWLLSIYDPDTYADPGKRESLHHERKRHRLEIKELEERVRIAAAKADIAEAAAELARRGDGDWFDSLDDMTGDDADEIMAMAVRHLRRERRREARELEAATIAAAEQAVAGLKVVDDVAKESS